MSIEASKSDPVYVKFMEQLQAFHDRKGTVLQPDQILGGRHLNLHLIYKKVMEAGGYNQVSNSRTWKQIGECFNFPSTCTNSAYILKAVYTKNLLGWEQEMHWHQFWTPPQDEVKGKGGSATNTVIRPKDEARHTATALLQPQNASSNVPTRMTASTGIALGSPAHIDEEFRSRILLALQSSLPNEVDWVFNTLIKFSFASENFCLDFMPTLVDHLVTFVEPFFNKYVQPDVNNRKKNDDDDDDLGYMLHRVFCSKEDLEIFERTLQVFHIIRNFSFLDNNIRHLAHHDTLRHYLMTGITLSPSSQFAELTRQCLDILENIAPQVIVHSPDDPYLVAMSYLLLSNDRALILGAIRSLTRVAVTEVNERVLCIPKVDLMERLFQLLLVDDEELVAATLEYFYQYTSLRGDFGTQLVKTYPGNLMGLLTGFLSYKSSLVPLSSTTNHYINETIHGIPAAQLAASQNARAEQAKIPDLTDYLNLDEPFRCLGWLKDILETGNSNDTLALKECFNRYQEKFSGNKPFGLKEFYTVLVIAFPQPAEVQKAAAGPAPLIDLVLQNIKYGPDKRHEAMTCHWNNCGKVIDDNEGLLTHVMTAHIPEETAGATKELLDCHWKNCTRKQIPRRAALIGHVRTHVEPLAIGSKYNKKKRSITKVPVDKLLIDDSEVSGVPLTAALLLRNLAMNKQHVSSILPYEAELSALALQRPKLSKYILTVLSKL